MDSLSIPNSPEDNSSFTPSSSSPSTTTTTPLDHSASSDLHIEEQLELIDHGEEDIADDKDTTTQDQQEDPADADDKMNFSSPHHNYYHNQSYQQQRQQQQQSQSQQHHHRFSSSQTFLNMEDLETPSTSPPPSLTHSYATSTNSSASQSSPAPVIVHSKAAKKRKSWGQELPQPKTNLPPRKRAKTDDEKEQRRIERIKRNRAAAHNSRERKRQEAEGLAVALAHANAELEAYRRLHGPLPADIVLPEVTVVTESADTPVPSLTDGRSSMDEAGTGPSSPADSLWHNSMIKQEPLHDSLLPMHLPASSFERESPLLNAAKPSLLALNPTQHSAEMLCDLPCRFSLSSARPTPRSTPTAVRTTPTPSWWATLFLSLLPPTPPQLPRTSSSIRSFSSMPTPLPHAAPVSAH
ncbi:uncharacterized protein K489DRAFT_270990 [Dissoconium aciculare CBS 342.82]|uniref:BZIP domain-containing protein n=1 Tax=Dissoconium aciculare CBS 342.82 TaxID=1314786 RepID=A0A6J3LZS8_9PEZI|nr:uncharacterized protein K489DRAFT_270990 [Dissoconium aciculare CBS 342.82]KAF1821295.1 hypothetical protein K489DRAFT_270990 [Dissoconium aciculare CBS 342.82]